MELTPTQQASTTLRQAKMPLIVLPSNPSSDAVAGGLGLLMVLEKLGKSVRIVSPDFTLPPGHSFLPKSDAIQQQLTSLRNFIISVDVSHTKLESLSYDIRDNQLHIYLSPRQGFFEERDVTTSAGNYAHDLIVVLDSPSLDGLGDIYQNNTEFFYQTPILNIDHHAENTRFGHVNVVDLVSSSVSETVFEIIKNLGFEHLDEQVATSLLTGIISKTKMFQNYRVTPRSLAVASHLMTAGARRNEIIQSLYQTKSLPILKLWGRVLSRIQTSDNGQIVWSVVEKPDLVATGTNPAEAVGALDELMVNTPSAKFVCLFVETEDRVMVHLLHPVDQLPKNLPTSIIANGPQYLGGPVSGSLHEVEGTILQSIRSELK